MHLCGWNGKSQACALAFLQLSANPAVARTVPALSPTNASAKTAGTGDTAIRVSEKQALRVRIGGLTHPTPYRNNCLESLSSLVNDAKAPFFLVFNPNNETKIFNTS